jgi:hypothetical protein
METTAVIFGPIFKRFANTSVDFALVWSVNPNFFVGPTFGCPWRWFSLVIHNDLFHFYPTADCWFIGVAAGHATGPRPNGRPYPTNVLRQWSMPALMAVLRPWFLRKEINS